MAKEAERPPESPGSSKAAGSSFTFREKATLAATEVAAAEPGRKPGGSLSPSRYKSVAERLDRMANEAGIALPDPEELPGFCSDEEEEVCV